MFEDIHEVGASTGLDLVDLLPVLVRIGRLERLASVAVQAGVELLEWLLLCLKVLFSDKLST